MRHGQYRSARLPRQIKGPKLASFATKFFSPLEPALMQRPGSPKIQQHNAICRVTRQCCGLFHENQFAFGQSGVSELEERTHFRKCRNKQSVILAGFPGDLNHPIRIDHSFLDQVRAAQNLVA